MVFERFVDATLGVPSFSRDENERKYFIPLYFSVNNLSPFAGLSLA
jgi:hypothetical protein